MCMMRTSNILLLLLPIISTPSCTLAYNWDEHYCSVRFFDGSNKCTTARDEKGQARQWDVHYAYLCGDDHKCIQGKTVECCLGVEEIQSTADSDALHLLLFLPDNTSHVHLMCHTSPSRHDACETKNKRTMSDWLLNVIMPITLPIVAVTVIALVCWLVRSKHNPQRAAIDQEGSALDFTVKTCDDEDDTSENSV